MNTPYHSKALPQGTILREWRLEEVLGVGGFGIVYRGKGVYFEELVAIKEYFPGAISDRQDGTTVTPTDSSSEEIYDLGLKKFVEEAKVLWNLSKPTRHPNIVSVRSLFEIHGTAYMVMDFEKGVSLSQMLREGRRFDEASLLDLIRPIAEGLDRAHRGGVLHRDIKPANILVDETGRPVLIDFGSARFDSGQATSTKVTFYTPPYAAIEQYVKTYPQGPWTDIYALGVTLYQCVTGEKPPEVLERLHGGLGEALSARERPGFSRAFTRAIDAAMAIRPAERPQSIPEWLKLFDAPDFAEEDEATRIGAPLQTPSSPQPPPSPEPPTQAQPPQPPAAAATVADRSPMVAAPAGEADAQQAAARRTPPWMLAAGAALVVALGAGAVVVMRPGHQTPAAATAPSAPAAAPSAAPQFAPQALVQGADALVADAQRMGRPAAETAVLASSKARLRALAAQIGSLGSAPDASAKAAPLAAAMNQEAHSMSHGEAAALDRVAASQWHEVDRTLGKAPASDASAAVSKVRQAKTDLDAAIATVSQAADGAQAIDGARHALTMFAAFSDAYGAATPFFAPAKRAELATATAAARATSSQVIALASGPKPWLFASQGRKQAYQSLQANAARARAEAAQMDQLSQSMASTSDLRRLDSALAQAASAKRDLASLYASSRAAAAAGAGGATPRSR